MGVTILKCNSCGASLKDMDENNNACPYCGSLFETKNQPEQQATMPSSTLSEREAREAHESLEYIKRLTPSNAGKTIGVGIEKTTMSLLKIVLYPIAVVLVLAGLILTLVAKDPDHVLFWILGVPGLLLFSVPRTIKSKSIINRMKLQLKGDGIYMLEHFKIQPSSSQEKCGYFVTATKHAYVFWNENGSYTINSKYEVAKCEEFIDTYKADKDTMCSSYKLILSFNDLRPNEEIILINHLNKSSTGSNNYLIAKQSAAAIKNFFKRLDTK